MEYRILGPLEVLRDGVPVDIGRYKLRALLALLLINAGEVVSTDRIIDEVWGDDASSDKQNSLWVAISGLRSALDPDREKRTDGTVLLTRSPGYLIDARGAAIDARRFEQLATEGRALLEADPQAASLVLHEALALWRGHALEEFTYESFAQAEIARLEEMRLATVEDRVLADLRSGRDRELVGELESLVRQHPLRERLTGHLMVALHRSGRQAEALRTFGALWTRLGEELGIEPGAEIARLEERIVLDDPDLIGAAATGAGPGLSIRGYELRDRISESPVGYVYRAYQPSVGREVAVKVVRPELANDPDFIRRFEAEAQLVSRLDHPGIVPLFDYWREPDAAYLVTRRFEGGNLADSLASGPLDTATALRIVEQVGAALAAAHRRGVAHGDLKPGNVLLDSEGNAYVSDFGLALPGSDGEFAAPEGGATPASDIYSLGALAAAVLRGATGTHDSPLVGPTAAVVATATAPDPAERHADVETFLTELAESVGAETETAIGVDNPYKGLRAFEEGDAGRFFGRERLVERLITRLGHAGPQGKLVALVGPSGAGKSSVVRAGLIPAIRTGALPRSERWFIVTMTPGHHPFESLEEALRTVAVDPPASILELLTERGIGPTVDSLLPEEGSQLLLLVDQLEELFTHSTESTADQFLDALAAAAGAKHGPVKVVATLRADFYDHPLRHESFGELLRLGSEVITPMTAQELERAISGPAEAAGVSFEQGLVAHIVADMKGQSSALPLLQYALTELFDARTGRTITTEAYVELGGVSAALVRRADNIYGGLAPAAQQATRNIFLRLVTLGEGAEDTRRRVLQSELVDVGGAAAVEVLDKFGRHRLLSFDRDPVSRGPSVEIAHEAMLTEWRRLREWVEGARHDVRNQRRLSAAMAEWVAAGKDDQYLLSGGRLQQLEAWATTSGLPLAETEQAFLDASVAAREAVRAQERGQEQRAQAAEQREQKRARQLAGVGVVSLVVAMLAAFGIWQWRSASAANAEVEALLTVADLVTASEAALPTDPELAVLLAVEAVRESAELGFATEEAVDAVHWGLQEIGAQYDIGPDTPVALRTGPGGPTGVWALPPAELIDFAASAVDRQLTDAECERHLGGACSSLRQLTPDLDVRGGMEAYGATAFESGTLAGTRITFAATGAYAEDDGLTAQLDAFTAATGIEVEQVLENFDDVQLLLSGEAAVPDVLNWFATLPLWMRERALDIDKVLDPETTRSSFDPYILTFGTLGPDGQSPSDVGTLKAVPFDIDLKGLVYYPKAAFEAAGYEIPRSIEELQALSEQIAATGDTPWCWGFASGFASGWPGTDFIESLVLRVAGPDRYDEWRLGDLPFTSPEVLAAGAIANDFFFAPGFVNNGVEAISNESFDAQTFHMLERDRVTGEPKPDCWFLHQSDFIFSIRPPGTQIGVDTAFFPLPPLDPSETAPATGNVISASGMVDRPEVRAFLEFIASPEWGEVWALERERINFLPAHRQFDTTAYGPPDDPLAAQRVAMVRMVHDALDAGVYRFDASDQMPPPLGAGSFWVGMLDWVDGIRSYEQVFADLDAHYAELLAEG